MLDRMLCPTTAVTDGNCKLPMAASTTDDVYLSKWIRRTGVVDWTGAGAAAEHGEEEIPGWGGCTAPNGGLRHDKMRSAGGCATATTTGEVVLVRPKAPSKDGGEP